MTDTVYYGGKEPGIAIDYFTWLKSNAEVAEWVQLAATIDRKRHPVQLTDLSLFGDYVPLESSLSLSKLFFMVIFLVSYSR